MSVRKTFIASKSGVKPAVFINSPVDITNHLGRDLKKNKNDYKLLKLRLKEMVKDPANKIF